MKDNSCSYGNSLLLILFLAVYEFSTTIYSLPYSDVLRWVICFILVIVDIIYAITINKGFFALLPSEYAFLVFPLIIQSFWNREQIGIALARSFSFVVYSMAIVSLFHRKSMTSVKIKKLFYLFYAFLVIIILPLNIIAFNRTSILGDYLGIYPNRNMTVSVLLSVFVILGIILLIRKGKSRIVAIVIICVMLLTTILIFRTHSRVAVIGIVVATFMLWYYASTKKNGFRIIAIGIIAVITVCFLPEIGVRFNIVSIERLFAKTVANGSTGFFRNSIWAKFTELVKQRPLFGWGNNSVYYNTFINPVNGGWGVHNSYYVMLVEGGIVGFACYILFFVSFFIHCKRDYNECIALNMDRDSILLVRYCFITCIVLAINAFSESFLFSAGNLLSLPFWFGMIGCKYFLKQKKKELRESEIIGVMIS